MDPGEVFFVCFLYIKPETKSQMFELGGQKA